MVVMVLLCCHITAYAQSAVSVSDKVLDFPSGLINHIRHKTADLDQQLTLQTEKCLRRMAKKEDRLKKKLYRIDSASAKNLFANSSNQYAALANKMQTDTGTPHNTVQGEYQPNTDSLRNSLAFLQQNPQLLAGISSGAAATDPAKLSPQVQAQLQGSISQLQALEAKMQDADEVKQYIRERKEQIGQYISQHAGLAGLLGKDYQGMNQDIYYYSQQVREYKAMLNDPDKLEQKALSLLNQLPAFQGFMKNNSQLAGLFNLPGNYGDAQGLLGLQTRDQVGQLIQTQVAAGGSGGAAALQSNLQSAESQLDTYKDKLNQLGAGSGDMDMPNFKPNDQKTRTFWKRLEYGANFQTTRNTNYFPTVTDLGLSLGYRLGHSNTIGIGASYKIGWGNGWNHIAFSSQGIGLRTFIDIKLKSSFFISGGFEYNYTTPITSFQQIDHLSDWTQSGLIGLSKTVSVKSKVFKKTKLSLLWDFLSYQQIPKTQPLVFRIGYGF